MHLLFKRWSYVVLFLANFDIWSGGSQEFFVDHLNIFCMYAEMGNDESTEMQLQIEHSPNPSLFVTTLKLTGQA